MQKNLKDVFVKKTVVVVNAEITLINCVFIAALEEEPTAFDPDKVAEKLEADKVHTFYGCINKRYAIEIVKAGGINDNPD